MIYDRLACLFSALFLAGCVGVGDQMVYLKGFVKDTKGVPIEGLEISYNGVVEKTDTKGCFYYGGSYPSREIEIIISPVQEDSIRIKRSSGQYNINIELSEAESSRDATVVWLPVTGEYAWENQGCENA